MTDPATTLQEGTVMEVLQGYGLAHVATSDGAVYGLNRQTPGIDFNELREGQQIGLKLEPKFGRVASAWMIA